MDHTCDLLAEAMQYPAPGRLEMLLEGASRVPPGAARKALERFLREIRVLSLSQWEELHTRTMDLNPPGAPYIGYQTWGESYQRGAFLAKMNRALWETGVDTGGELPDHLAPVLRYLSASPAPQAELLEVMEPAVRRMQDALRKADAQNPYLHLFEAIAQVLAAVKQPWVGVEEKGAKAPNTAAPQNGSFPFGGIV